jgi:hypothetical protein
MGTEIDPRAMRLFVDDLEPLTDEAIQHALVRCRRELRGKNGFPPMLTIADVLDRAGVVSEAETNGAEARAAWDALLRYAEKYIVADPEGDYGPRHYFGMKTDIPKLDQRTLDTLRRIGGWRVVKTMNQDDYPHVQRRFYEEYRAWQATDAALRRGALNGVLGFTELLASKAMPGQQQLGASSSKTRSKTLALLDVRSEA